MAHDAFVPALTTSVPLFHIGLFALSTSQMRKVEEYHNIFSVILLILSANRTNKDEFLRCRIRNGSEND